MRRCGVTLLIAAIGLWAAAGEPAAAQTHTRVSPYIELDQTFLADLKGGSDDVLTYSSVAVGVDASIATPRTQGTASLRYEHQFGWGRRAADSDILSGITRARYSVVQNRLSIEGGAFATRVRTDGLSSANGALVSAGDAVTHVYSAYAGPTLTTHAGDMSVNAAYRLGYSRVDDDVNVTVGGVPAYGAFDDSVYQTATVSVGMQPGPLPVGWALGAGWEHEDVTELDQNYDNKWVRGDLTVPVTPAVALVGGAGYEAIRIDQRAALLDSTGNPVLDRKGRLISDTSVPRLIAYDTDGLIWDVGVLWRPSRRTSLEARAGHRYGGAYYAADFSWRASPNSLLQIAYYDRIDSFGRAIQGNLIAVPTGFDVQRNPFSGDLAGCVGGAQGGTCFNDSLAAINGSNFRHRGVAAMFNHGSMRWNWGAGMGWSRRTFIAPRNSIFAAVNGTHDDYYFAEIFGGYRLTRSSSIGGTLYANYFDAPAGGIDVTNYGSYVTYNRLFGRRLSAQAALGLDAVDTSDLETIISLLGQVGVRYQF